MHLDQGHANCVAYATHLSGVGAGRHLQEQGGITRTGRQGKRTGLRERGAERCTPAPVVVVVDLSASGVQQLELWVDEGAIHAEPTQRRTNAADQRPLVPVAADDKADDKRLVAVPAVLRTERWESRGGTTVRTTVLLEAEPTLFRAMRVWLPASPVCMFVSASLV